MGFLQGDGIAGKVFITLVATFLIYLLSSFAENAIKGGKAYDELQTVKPKVDTLCRRVERLENEPKKWKDAALELLEKSDESYNRRTYKDSIRMFEAIESLKRAKK